MRRPATMGSLAPAGALIVALCLGGCAAEGGRAVSDNPLPHNEVQTVPERMALAFAPGSAQLSDASARQLTVFLAGAEVRRGDSVGIAVAGGGSLDQQRRAAVADRLLSMGYKPAIAEALQTEPASLRNGPVTVTAYRYMVIPPNCPNWSGKTHNDWQNQLGSNFGCATESDLALMVANPRDLIQGQAGGSGDGIISEEAIARYRTGKVTPPKSGASLGIGS